MRITTVFITPFCNVLKRIFFSFCLLLVVPAWADNSEGPVTTLYATLKPADESLLLSATLEIRLNKTQEDALKKGLSLHFLTDFELQRIRAWWFNEDMVSISRAGRLTYNLLTRRYQLETAEGYKAFDTLREALVELGKIENWAVAPKKLLKPGDHYQASLRLRLDQGQLPKPLQINALASGKWEVEGEWYRWEQRP